MSLKQAMQSLRPPSPNEVCNIVAAEYSKLLLLSSSSLCCNIKLVYALHGGCNGQSMSYLANITQCLGSRENEGKATTMEQGQTSHDADRHFCAMINAAVFIEGNGGFSYLAERVRKWRGLQTVSNLRTESRYTSWLDAEKESAKEQEKEEAKKGTQLKEMNNAAEYELGELIHRAKELGILDNLEADERTLNSATI
jgi:hypothetical protein